MMQEEKFSFFKNRLFKVFRHLSKLAKRQDITCYRIYDHDLPEFPFCIEIYEKQVYVAEYKRRHGMTDDEHEAWLQKSMEIISEVLDVSKDQIFIKLRQKKPGRTGQYQKQETDKTERIVSEGGLQFVVDLSSYLDTGLFLDHRITRSMVRDEIRMRKSQTGKSIRVLNLFAYTGSFSVYAVAGGADEVDTVDLSNTYLTIAKKNFLINGFESNSFRFIQADVLSFLKESLNEQYDLIILDPPTFSNSKRMKGDFDIQTHHAPLIVDTLRLLKPDGVLFFSTNARKFVLEKDAIPAKTIRDITGATTPFDFAGKLFRYCYRIEK